MNLMQLIRKFPFRAVVVLFVLFLVFLFFGGRSYEGRRGTKVWNEAQERAEKAGVSLLRSDYVGAEIPDDENLLKNLVFLKEFENEGEDRLTRWDKLPEVTKGNRTRSHPVTGEVLEYSGYFEEKLTEDEARVRLAEAAKDFDVRLDDLSKVILTTPVHAIFAKSASDSPLLEFGGELGPLSALSGCLKSSAMMALRSGDSSKAFERMRVLDRWGRSIGSPSLVLYLLGNSTRMQNLNLIWEGIRLRTWSEDELEGVSKLLVEWNPREDFQNTMRFETAFRVESLDHPEVLKMYSYGSKNEKGMQEKLRLWWSFGGFSGWRDQRKALLVNKYLDLIEVLEEGGSGDKEKVSEGLDVGAWSPLLGTAEQIKFSSVNLYERHLSVETLRRIALIAIALERHFLAHQSYPVSLANLELEFPTTDLADPKGRDLSYELGPGGRPVIFSKHEDETKKRNRQLRWQFYAEKKK